MLAALAGAVMTEFLISRLELIGAAIAFVLGLVTATYYTSPYTVGFLSGVTAALIFYFLRRA